MNTQEYNTIEEGKSPNNYHITAENNDVISYINSESFKSFSKWKKLSFLNYIAWKSQWKLQQKQSELLQYLEIKNSNIIKESESNNTFDININNPITLENEWIMFETILSQLDLSYNIIHNTLQQSEAQKEKLSNKIRIFKM